MKKIILFVALLSCFVGKAQYNSLAPWNTTNSSAKSERVSIDEVVQSFNQYWENRDHSKRGSGFKPFLRWENHWRNKTNDQGYLITPQEMWDAFNQKKAAKANKSSNLLMLPTSNWEPVGPFTHSNTGSWSSGQGRVNIVYVDPSNPNTIYIGAPAGGIWKSLDAGTTWAPLSDNLPQIGVSGIAVDPNNSNVIYVATGDCDASDTYSIGVLKTTNGGATWNTTGLTFTGTNKLAGDILMNPSNSNMLWAATTDGIYRTLNGGTTWTLEQAGNFSQGRIRLKPGDPNTVYAVSTNRFYKSTNAGDTFSSLATGLPFSSGRMLMDVTAADSNYIYILSTTTSGAMQGVYRSTNGGTNWTLTSGTNDTFNGSGQSGYDLAFAVSQTNANEIYTGCLNVWKSLDAGATFNQLNSWSAPTQATYTHADIHYLQFFGTKLYCGSDGGVYVSENNGTSFTDKTAGAQISQFYKIAVSKQSASKMVGGLQDNGGHAYSGSQWKNYYGADGMDTAIDPTNSNLYYGFIQFGSNLYISTNSGNSLSSGVGAPAAETGTNDDGGNWITPLVANNTGELFAGYSNLYKLVGGAWQLQNAGSPTGSGNIELVAVDPSNDDNMYVVNGSGLHKSTNRGLTFTQVYSAPGNITSIDVHSSNSNIIYITTQGTSGQALKSINGGTSFTSFSSGLPAIGKNVIVHQGRDTNNPLYLGTSLGVYYTDDTMSQWEPFDTNLPNVSVTDLEINLEDEKIIAATYGRGIWQSAIQIQTPLNDIKFNEIQNPSSVNINCANAVTPQVSVKNNGSNTINSVNFNYTVNAVTYTFTWTGTINSEQTQVISLPAVTLPKGIYTMNVVSTIAGDAYSDNNSGSTNFYLNNSGTVNVTNTFETATDELIEYNESSTTGIWTRGVRTGGALASGLNNVYSTNLTGNYPDLTKSYLVSQCYDLSSLAGPQISFKMAFDLENNWDLTYVEYSTNFGQTWQVLGTQGPNWYNSNRTPESSGTDCFNCVGAQWTGTNAALTTYFYSLAALSTETNVIFRIVFHSDEAENNLGVVVDDFLISGTLANESFNLNNIQIYPNPSTGIYNISAGNATIDEIVVYDVMGKIINSNKNIQTNGSNSTIDLTSISSGIYFVKITANEQSTVKRIIKK
ncbi:T9SS type A sorting domain-containing protein [Flavobacterium aquatile]|uniref:Glycosyl hydrolase n=1 Tax=Flavobacterium aquatile LMG 4008 = ATCC 11947 TaxID=1453498 RepID=A0A095SW18_9FLAO|nr:T9SS type A sorting domain-containing protein [Flavobacterium aquatile]KGD68876.1 glycosyl hydrolase [Flavobacterium aquatile LMG 4008 = ATCC 11947]OXA69392.1 glycosyl hydrolase [Flavobacterium aquatile] [Flavobacterium aquatile LMG 4008 = ATCC 11947]GEC79365.1 glycosyl hydrolase [Flavobacterium aquatile]